MFLSCSRVNEVTRELELRLWLFSPHQCGQGQLYQVQLVVTWIAGRLLTSTASGAGFGGQHYSSTANRNQCDIGHASTPDSRYI